MGTSFLIILSYNRPGLRTEKFHQGKTQEPGFTIASRKSRQVHAVVLANLDYADDIVLISDRVEQAQELETRGEMEMWSVFLLNARTTPPSAHHGKRR